MPNANPRSRPQVRSDDIRAHVVARYLQPARRSGHATFSIRIGDVMRDLPGILGVNAPCSALRSERKFQRPNRIRLIRDEGPPSGMGYNTVLTFEFIAPVNDEKSAESETTSAHPAGPSVATAVAGLLEMYGVAGDTYKPFGGGDAMLEKVREGWS